MPNLVSWVVGAAAAVAIAVGAGVVDVSGLLPEPPVAAPAPVTVPATAAPVVVVVTSRPAPAPAGDCAGGRRQREVESSLAALGGYRHVTVDGETSAADCAAIRAFQKRYGIRPARGQVDRVTADVARRLAASPLSSCAAPAGTVACVDLTTQTAWAVRDGAVVFGPTVVRTGYRGHATPTGTFAVNKRTRKEWSDPYAVWLPYWQRFVGGVGFHETTSYLHDKKRGSHGCVNLLHDDAVALWDLLEKGSAVHTFGRRPGT